MSDRPDVLHPEQERCVHSIHNYDTASLTLSLLDVVVASAIVVLKLLVQIKLQQQQQSQIAIPDVYSPLLIISRLAYRIDEINHPDARACILWLVGQYAGAESSTITLSAAPEGVAPWAPDVLRKSAIVFGQQVCSITPQG